MSKCSVRPTNKVSCLKFIHHLWTFIKKSLWLRKPGTKYKRLPSLCTPTHAITHFNGVLRDRQHFLPLPTSSLGNKKAIHTFSFVISAVDFFPPSFLACPKVGFVAYVRWMGKGAIRVRAWRKLDRRSLQNNVFDIHNYSHGEHIRSIQDVLLVI